MGGVKEPGFVEQIVAATHAGEHDGRLKKNAVGLTGVLFLTVTGAAPMSAMLGNVPFSAGFGVGQYVPAAFLLATIVLTIFSVGYAAMASKISSAGGFYSFISHGLGREVGMSAGLASLVAYSIFEAALCGLFAYFTNAWLAQHFDLAVSWHVIALIMVIAVGIMSYFDVKFSAAFLGLFLVLEVLLLLVFDFAVFTAGAGTNITLEPLNLFKVLTPVAEQNVNGVAIAAGAAAVGIFMAFWSWVGFEMAPNYAEESVDPKRIVPKSLYYSVIGLGLFYVVTSWAAVSAFPSEGAMLAKAVGDSGNFFLEPMRAFAGGAMAEVMSILIITSSLACGMAFHNTAARYMYSLGREGVLPRSLGSTHARYHSPHRASIVQSVLALIWVSLFALSLGTDDPTAQAYVGLYTLLAILGTMLLLTLQALVSVAILVYFRKHHAHEGKPFSVVVAPVISFLAQAALIYLLVDNLSTLGGAGAFGSNIPTIGLAIFVVGLIWDFLLKSFAPEAYQQIGLVETDN